MRRCNMKIIGQVLLFGLVATGAAGCDFFQGSGTGTRVSPIVGGLAISRPSVLCGQNFGIAFDYNDPQKDIATLVVTLQHSTSSATHTKRVNWVSGATLDLTVGSRATYTTSLSCTDPGGVWTITVQLEDLRGNESNILSGAITLVSAG